MSTGRTVTAVAAFLLALATALGAFGAHALEARLTPDRLAVYETGVRYLFFHTLGLLAIGLGFERLPQRAVRVSSLLLIVGMVLFSGSIFALTFGAPRTLGAITPLGGLSLMAAWVLLGAAALRTPSR